MPEVHSRRRAGLRGTPRTQLPVPGVGGYDYPRGPFGATGFPGSTPASKRTKSEGPDGRKDPSFRGRPTLTATQIRERDTGPRFDVGQWETPKPQPSHGSARFRPGNTEPASEFIGPDGLPRNPYPRTGHETAPEHRMTPHIGANGYEQRKPVRNQVAQRWKADPSSVRGYRPAANPGKTGAHLDGTSRYHPGTYVRGHPDGRPVPGMSPVDDPQVVVESRFVSREGAQEGYAMNRPLVFAHGGVAGFPEGFTGNRHLRGSRLTGQRYFGLISEQQEIGLDSDSYGIARRRGPRHRPVRFEQPAPWTAHYYDIPGEADEVPDMIHRSPVAPRRRRGPRRG